MTPLVQPGTTAARQPPAPAKIAFFAGPEHEGFDIGPVDGPAALLIHGFAGTPAELRPLAGRLAGAGWRARGLLLPGFGAAIDRLGHVRGQDWLAAVRQAHAALRRPGRPTVIAGYSLGGALAVAAAADSPVDGLVLLAPFWRLAHPLARLLPLLKHLRPTMAPFATADFAEPEVRRQMAALLPGADLDDPAVQDRVRAEIRLPLAALDEVRRLGKIAYDAAPRVTAPALVLQGRRDSTVEPAQTRQLLARLGGPVSYVELPVGHSLAEWEDRGGNGRSPDYLHLVVDHLQTHFVS